MGNSKLEKYLNEKTEIKEADGMKKLKKNVDNVVENAMNDLKDMKEMFSGKGTPNKSDLEKKSKNIKDSASKLEKMAKELFNL